MTDDRRTMRTAPSRPRELSALLDHLARQLPVILGRNFVGIYLYGSLTLGAFHPGHSDVDCLVVTGGAVTRTQFLALRRWLADAATRNAWTARLHVSFLAKRRLLTTDPTACLVQRGLLKRTSLHAGPINWLNVLENGIMLAGPPPASLLPTVSRRSLVRALAYEMRELRVVFQGTRRSV